MTTAGYEHTRWWSLAVTPDGKTVVALPGRSGQNLGAVVIWDTASCKEAGVLLGHSDYVRAVAVPAG